jgi:signal recognition particle subunit SRP54
MGDIVSLVEKAAQNIDLEKAARTAERMRKGQFDLNDLKEQLTGMQQMGGMTGMMALLPVIDGNLPAIALLRRAGVDYSKLRYRGETAVDLAREAGDTVLLEALVGREGTTL